MDAFFSLAPLSDVARVVAAFRPLERWLPGDVLMQRLDPARNNGIRAQLMAIERACRAGRIYAEERRITPRLLDRIVCYRIVV